MELKYSLTKICHTPRQKIMIHLAYGGRVVTWQETNLSEPKSPTVLAKCSKRHLGC